MEPGDKGMVTIIPLSAAPNPRGEHITLFPNKPFGKSFSFYGVPRRVSIFFCLLAILSPITWLSFRGTVKKTNSIFKDIIQIEVDPLPPTLFLTIFFAILLIMLTSLPPLEFLTKNPEILGFETYILYYHYYFLRARGTNRKTQSPFKWFFSLKASFKYLVGPDWVINHTK